MRMRRATVSEEADTVFQGEGPFGLLAFLYYAGIRRRGGLASMPQSAVSAFAYRGSTMARNETLGYSGLFPVDNNTSL